MLQKLCNLHELQVSIREIVIPPRINCHADSFSQMSCKVSVFKFPIFRKGRLIKLTRSKLDFDWRSRSWACAYIIQVTIWKRADFCSFLYFAISKERLNSGTKIRYFSKYPIIYKKRNIEIKTFLHEISICKHNPIIKIE